MTISERIAAARRERRVPARVSRAACRLEQAERERTWALVSSRAEGISICTLAAAAGLSAEFGTGPGDGPGWTPAEIIAGIGFVAAILVQLAFEVDAAQAEGRPVDVADFLDTCAMGLTLMVAAGRPRQGRPEAGAMRYLAGR